MRIPIHRQGWPFIVLGVGFNALLILWLGWWGLVATPVVLWIISFFRDPDRAPPLGEGLIVSPADGILLPVAQAPPPPDLGLGPEVRTRLSIFMTFFHVHVNRIPETGTIEALAYKAGKFLNASFDKASEHNERMAVGLRLGNGQVLVIVQIAGLVARRISCALTKGQTVCRGDRFGIIRFGSRLDLYLPGGAQVVAAKGQTVRAGETVLAHYRG